MTSSINELHCQYLFSSSCDQVFNLKNLSVPSGVDKSRFIERCLQLTIRVHVYLFSHHDAILLLDPRAFNKQCQLYALRACQIHTTYSQKTEEEKIARTEENRFLHLGFILNYAFREKDLYSKTILSMTQRVQKNPFDNELSAHSFKKFISSQRECREKAARSAFNLLFEQHTKLALDELRKISPVSEERALLSEENLRVNGSSLNEKCEALYTYPKLTGLAFMIDVLRRDKLQFVLKIKVVNEQGSGGMVRYVSGPIQENDPVVVFAGFATDGSCSALEYMEKAKDCPSSLYRSHAKTRHAAKASCFNCTPTQIDLAAQQARLDRVMKEPDKFLLALGTEFMEQSQQPFLSHFKSDKYPHLHQEFISAKQHLEKLELYTDNTRSLAIYHTITELGKDALSDTFPLDASPEQFLKNKGVIIS